MRKLTTALGLLLLGVTLVAAACGDDDEETIDTSSDGSESGAMTVEVDDFYFKPTALNAQPGQTLTVKVENEGKAEHTFTIDNLSVDEEIPAGQEKEIEVSAVESGQFEFYCRYHHSQMTGTITFGDGSAAAPTKDGGSSNGYYGY